MVSNVAKRNHRDFLLYVCERREKERKKIIQRSEEKK